MIDRVSAVNEAYGTTVYTREHVDAMPIGEVYMCAGLVSHKRAMAAGRRMGSREGLGLGESRDASQD